MPLTSEQREAAEIELGWIYFIEALGFIKIGFTRSAVARVKKMMTDIPVRPRFLHAEPGTFRTEKIFHRHFAAIRRHGEWFEKTDELVAFIEQRKRICPLRPGE